MTKQSEYRELLRSKTREKRFDMQPKEEAAEKPVEKKVKKPVKKKAKK